MNVFGTQFRRYSASPSSKQARVLPECDVLQILTEHDRSSTALTSSGCAPALQADRLIDTPAITRRQEKSGRKEACGRVPPYFFQCPYTVDLDSPSFSITSFRLNPAALSSLIA